MNFFYRKEIEGLRAIAVISVILYHTKLIFNNHEVFQGGFIGVDIFFVISGYLISSIIFNEIKKNNFFSIKYFYQRRIRRIIPLLLIVLAFSYLAAWIYLLPSNYVELSKSSLSSLFFLSNFYFYFTGLEYGGANSLLIPLLHTWSLSVEGQFYLIYPLIIFVIFKYFRNKIILFLAIFFIFSFILSIYLSNYSPYFNFYNLGSRVWELLAGSIISYFHFYNYEKVGKVNTKYFKIIGILLIVISVFFLNDRMNLPSYITVFPVLGTCLIIFDINTNNNVITKILNSRPFVFTGLISYSLFLWHYPIFSYYRIQKIGDPTILTIIFVSIILITLSILTYYYAEKPARNKKLSFVRLSTILLALFLTIITLNFLTINNKGFKNRVPEIFSEHLTNQKPWLRLKNKNGEVCSFKNGCEFNSSSDQKVYLIGDSHMKSIAYDLKNQLVEENYHVRTAMIDGCYYFPGFSLYNKKTNRIDDNCNNEYFQQLQQILIQEKNSIFIFWGYLPDYINFGVSDNKDGKIGTFFIQEEEYKTLNSSFYSSIQKIITNNKIILVYPMPESDFNVPEKLLNLFPKKVSAQKLFIENLEYDEYLTIPFSKYEIDTKESFDFLDGINQKNVYRVYPHKLFCNNLILGKCITHDKTNIYYSDNNHPSLDGSKLITNIIMEKIREFQ